jgi:hypothetical protein
MTEVDIVYESDGEKKVVGKGVLNKDGTITDAEITDPEFRRLLLPSEFSFSLPFETQFSVDEDVIYPTAPGGTFSNG